MGVGLTLVELATLGDLLEAGDPFGAARVELLPRLSPFVLTRDILLIARREAGALRLSFGYAPGAAAEDGIRQLAEDLTSTLDGFAKDLAAPLPGPRPGL